MAVRKPTMEEKREAARKLILDVSMELFYTKGFDETTTRDIITKAGILNGSLYNRFKNKDEILVCMVHEGISRIMGEAKVLMAQENNILLASSFPGVIQIYLANRSERIANILYRVYCMWPAVEEYVTLMLGWLDEFLAGMGYSSTDPETRKLSMINLLGSIGNTVGYYSHGGRLPFREAIKIHINEVALSLKFPVADVDAIAKRLEQIVGSLELKFLGHTLSEEIPELSRIVE
ncbi:MAG: TetR/AcrR family transcriptional regulator [archaeon]|nr:TetR/AcrR family transcriptional regulator [archaeon]